MFSSLAELYRCLHNSNDKILSLEMKKNKTHSEQEELRALKVKRNEIQKEILKDWSGQ